VTDGWHTQRQETDHEPAIERNQDQEKRRATDGRSIVPAHGNRLFYFLCGDPAEGMCRLSDHFAASETLIRPTADKNLSEFRTVLSQLQGLAETADTRGCNSQTVFALSELKAGIADLQSATTDGQFLVHGIYSLFNAEDSSPLSQKGKAAVERLEGALNLLSREGVRGLD